MSSTALDRVRGKLEGFEDELMISMGVRSMLERSDCRYSGHVIGGASDTKSTLDYFLSKSECFFWERDNNHMTHYKEVCNYYIERLVKPIIVNNDSTIIKRGYCPYLIPQNLDDIKTILDICFADLNVISIISRRIALGKVVAEIKFEQEKDTYMSLLQNPNPELQILEKLTCKQTEDMLIDRISKKAGKYLTQPNSLGWMPDDIKNLYVDFIIPATKKVELQYFRSLFGSSQT